MEEINQRLKSYFKFLVVRHPLERLVSAFRSKFQRENRYPYAKDFEHFLPYIKSQGKGKNSNVSFSNFVSYLIIEYSISTSLFEENFSFDKLNPVKVDKKTAFQIAKRIDKNHDPKLLPKGSKYFNEHWAQFSTLCHPCHVSYDYVVKFETLLDDAAYVLTKLGPHNQCMEEKYPELFERSESSSSKFDKYFSTLTPIQVEMLKEIYSIDFKLFGYDDSEIR